MAGIVFEATGFKAFADALKQFDTLADKFDTKLNAVGKGLKGIDKPLRAITPRFNKFAKSIDKVSQSFSNLQVGQKIAGLSRSLDNLTKLNLSKLPTNLRKLANELNVFNRSVQNTRSIAEYATALKTLVTSLNNIGKSDVDISKLGDIEIPEGQSIGKKLISEVGRGISGSTRILQNTMSRVFDIAFRGITSGIGVGVNLTKIGGNFIKKLFDGISNSAKTLVRGSINAVKGAISSLGNQITRSFQDIANKLSTTSTSLIRGGINRIINGGIIGAIQSGAASLPVAAAVAFEDAFVGVLKVLNFDQFGGEETKAGQQFIADIESGIRSLATASDSSLSGLENAQQVITDITAAGAQLGVQNDELLGFAETIGKITIATNLGAEEAAFSLARLAAITGERQFDRVGASIVALGNTLPATEREIVEFATRMSGAATAAGITTQEILGLSGAFVALGLNPEAGGTAFTQLLNKMTSAVTAGGAELEKFSSLVGVSAEEFAESFRNEPIEALEEFFFAVSKLDSEDQLRFLDDANLDSIRTADLIRRSAANPELIAEALRTANEGFEENNALNEEAARRAATTKSAINRLRNTFRDLTITLGGFLLPSFNRVVDSFTGIISKINEWAKLNPELAGQLVRTFVTTTGLITAGFITLTGVLSTFIGIILAPLALGMQGVAAAVGAVAFAITHPVGLLFALSSSLVVIAAIGGAFAVALLIFNEVRSNAEGIGQSFLKFSDSLSEFANALISLGSELITLVGNVFQFGSGAGEAFQPIEFVLNKISGILDSITTRINSVTDGLSSLNNILGRGDDAAISGDPEAQNSVFERTVGLLGRRVALERRIAELNEGQVLSAEEYNFQVGDTISQLAQDLGLSTQDLLDFNDLTLEDLEGNISSIMIPVETDRAELANVQGDLFRLNELIDDISRTKPEIDNLGEGLGKGLEGFSKLFGDDTKEDILNFILGNRLAKSFEDIDKAAQDAGKAFGLLFNFKFKRGFSLLFKSLKEIGKEILNIGDALIDVSKLFVFGGTGGDIENALDRPFDKLFQQEDIDALADSIPTLDDVFGRNLFDTTSFGQTLRGALSEAFRGNFSELRDLIGSNIGKLFISGLKIAGGLIFGAPIAIISGLSDIIVAAINNDFLGIGEKIKNSETIQKIIEPFRDIKNTVSEFFNNIFDIDFNNQEASQSPLGSALFDLISFIDGAEDSINDIIDRIQPALDRFKEQVSPVINEFKESFETFIAIFEGVDVIPNLRPTGESISNFIKTVIDAFAGLSVGFIRGISRFFQSLTTAFGTFFSKIGKINTGNALTDILVNIKLFLEGVRNTFDALENIGFGVLDGIISFFETLTGLDLTFIRDFGENFIASVVDIARLVSTAIPGILLGAGALAVGVVDAFGKVLGGFQEFVSILEQNGITLEEIGTAIGLVFTVLGGAIGIFAEIIGTVLSAAIPLVGDLIVDLKQIGEDINTFITNLGDFSLEQTLTDAFKISTSIGDLIGTAIGGTVDIGDTILSKIGIDDAPGFASGIAGVLGLSLTAGGIKGLLAGDGFAGRIKGGITGAINGLTFAIRSIISLPFKIYGLINSVFIAQGGAGRIFFTKAANVIRSGLTLAINGLSFVASTFTKMASAVTSSITSAMSGITFPAAPFRTVGANLSTAIIGGVLVGLLVFTALTEEQKQSIRDFFNDLVGKILGVEDLDIGKEFEDFAISAINGLINAFSSGLETLKFTVSNVFREIKIQLLEFAADALGIISDIPLLGDKIAGDTELGIRLQLEALNREDLVADFVNDLRKEDFTGEITRAVANSGALNIPLNNAVRLNIRPEDIAEQAPDFANALSVRIKNNFEEALRTGIDDVDVEFSLLNFTHRIFNIEGLDALDVGQSLAPVFTELLSPFNTEIEKGNLVDTLLGAFETGDTEALTGLGIDVSSDVVQGIINGLAQPNQELTDATAQLGTDIESGLRLALESESPSQVALRIGTDVVAGLILGMTAASLGLLIPVTLINFQISRIGTAARNTVDTVKLSFLELPIVFNSLNKEFAKLSITFLTEAPKIERALVLLAGAAGQAADAIARTGGAISGITPPVVVGGNVPQRQFGGEVKAGNVYEILERNIPFEVFNTGGRSFFLPQTSGNIVSPLAAQQNVITPVQSPSPVSFSDSSSTQVNVEVNIDSVGGEVTDEAVSSLAQSIQQQTLEGLERAAKEKTLNDRLKRSGGI